MKTFAKTRLLTALLLAACSSGSPTKPPPAPSPPPTMVPGGAGGTSGEGGSGGGAQPVDAAPPPPVPQDASGGTGGGSPPPLPGDASTPVVTGGTALMVVGKGPLIGDDIQIQKVLESKGLKVETVADAMATAANTTGKRVVVLSYSLDSDLFKAKAEFAAVPAPLIVMEHALLGTLDMATNHKWAEPVTQISITNADSPLAGGLPAGDVTVYGKTGEVFWGVPSAAAIKVATVKGNANQWTIFAYAAGAMMMTKPAPGKRLQFFMGAHQVPTMYMNETGLKLLGASIDWSIQ